MTGSAIRVKTAYTKGVLDRLGRSSLNPFLRLCYSFMRRRTRSLYATAANP